MFLCTATSATSDASFVTVVGCPLRPPPPPPTRVFLVLTGACQFGHGVGGFTTNFIHSVPLASAARQNLLN